MVLSLQAIQCRACTDNLCLSLPTYLHISVVQSHTTLGSSETFLYLPPAQLNYKPAVSKRQQADGYKGCKPQTAGAAIISCINVTEKTMHLHLTKVQEATQQACSSATFLGG